MGARCGGPGAADQAKRSWGSGRAGAPLVYGTLVPLTGPRKLIQALRESEGLRCLRPARP